ncbi:DedA family protein [Alloacidobacterium sp.]|uniref:DedA family protein n=1 Tax=Alloacidobacterium sp. TaxID=2951999 RepID=UPI002D5C689A|nr:DedA family protein [Alloacidobacterium sp.]HYK34607.1 DedA family protein [Alloacidobacterium sp.]
MTEKILAVLASFIIAVISASGYAGIALLMAVESACIPLPSEIIMPFSGYLVHTGQLKLFWVATAGAIGCNLGSLVAYWIGAVGGRPFIMKYGRFVLLNQHDLDRAEHFFQRFGGITVFIGRLLPVVRTFIALPAGIARMPQLRFHLYTFLGSWPWCYVLAYVGMKLGQAWESDPRFKAAFHRFHLAVEIVIVIGIVWFIWTHWKNRVREQEA